MTATTKYISLDNLSRFLDNLKTKILSEKADKKDIPTKVSQLENDANYSKEIDWEYV